MAMYMKADQSVRENRLSIWSCVEHSVNLRRVHQKEEAVWLVEFFKKNAPDSVVIPCGYIPSCKNTAEFHYTFTRIRPI